MFIYILPFLAFCSLTFSTPLKGADTGIVPNDPICKLDSTSLSKINTDVSQVVDNAHLVTTAAFHTSTASILHMAVEGNTKIDNLAATVGMGLDITKSRDGFLASLPIHDYGFCSNSTTAGICRVVGFGVVLPVEDFMAISPSLSELGMRNAKLDIFTNGGLDAYLGYIAPRYGQNDFCLPLDIIAVANGEAPTTYNYVDPLDHGEIVTSCPSQHGAVLRVTIGDTVSTAWACADPGAQCLPLHADYVVARAVTPPPDATVKAYMPTSFKVYPKKP